MHRIGDVLSISCGLYRHYMIIIGDDLVVHASKEKKAVEAEALRDVCGGKQIANHGRWSKLSNAELILRANDELGKSYRIFGWNCDHVVRRISGTKVASPQVAMAMTTIVVGLIWFMRKRGA